MKIRVYILARVRVQTRKKQHTRKENKERKKQYTKKERRKEGKERNNIHKRM